MPSLSTILHTIVWTSLFNIVGLFANHLWVGIGNQ